MPVRYELDPMVTAPPAVPLLRRVPCYEPNPNNRGVEPRGCLRSTRQR